MIINKADMDLVCPNCHNKIIWNFDMIGPGVLHLHCYECNIQIHGYYPDEIIKLFNLYHKPNTCFIIRNKEIYDIDGKKVDKL